MGMIGAVAGDVVGSRFERDNAKTKQFELFGPGCRFTDDTVLTVALADTILTGKDCAKNLKAWARSYPDAGYGNAFWRWAAGETTGPYGSCGNGAAMRISPVGHAYGDLETVLAKAEEYTAATHNHPEGIKGGQATAAAIYLGRTGRSKAEIREYVEGRFGYDLGRHVDEIRPGYAYDASCQGTVPQAIRAFLDSTDYEDAIRTAVSLGGDSDTLACIAGGIAEAYYGGVPETIREKTFERLDARLAGVVREFMAAHCGKK